MNVSVEKKKILVAMSGGMDSSVTAALLKHQGHDVIGLYLQLWTPEASHPSPFTGRCVQNRLKVVEQVCQRIDIPLHTLNVEDAFQDQVVDYFVHEYLQCRAPASCTQCNRLKFNYFFQKADELGCSWVATGHYAQVSHDTTTQMTYLVKALDLPRDQTYFLSGLNQKTLQRLLMPIGGLTQSMVQRLAEEYGFDHSSDDKNRSPVCFISEDAYSAWIDQRVASSLRSTGIIRTTEGAIVGNHTGLYRFTIGQKKGLELRVKNPDHFFVVGFDAKTQSLIVGPEDQLFNKEMMASNANWLRPVDQLHGIRCHARISLKHEEALCTVTCFEDGKVHIEFDEAQREITPGQSVIFYKGNEVLGGAFIESIGGVSLS
jgi:tRNA-specific 2-thiouridylase